MRQKVKFTRQRAHTTEEVEGQLRATKLRLEARIGEEITDTMAILEWMIPRAADTINRFLVQLNTEYDTRKWQGV